MDAANRPDESALDYHGGGLATARRLFPLAPEPWLDLSTGINVSAFPFTAPSAESYTRLPEPEAVGALEAAAAARFGLGPRADIVAAPGTQALIQLLPRLIGAKTIAVLGFTYSEHERVWAQSGAAVTICDTLDQLAGADAAVIVNPNNPDGRLCATSDLRDLAQDMGARAKILIVDEAFADVLPADASLAPLLPLPGAVVLRSFGKAYGLAGVRLGFALGDAALTGAIRDALGPWAVSGAAAEIGTQAYRDAGWLAAQAAQLAQDSARLDTLLQAAGFEIIGGTPLFRLARHDAAGAIFRRLCEAGVLTRPYAQRPDWLRFGVPHGDADFAWLEKALRA